MNPKKKTNTETYPGFTIVQETNTPEARNSAYLEYRRKWEENPTKRIVDDFPLHLDIDVTTYCNLRCPMCPRTLINKHGDTLKNEYLSFETYIKVIDEGAVSGLCAVNLNFLGEPLLHPQIAQMVDYAHSKGILDIMMHTNATLLTPKLSGLLIDAGLNHIHFSLDAATENTYSKIRVGGNFKNVVENIKTFRKIRNEKKSALPIMRAQMVIMKDNFDEKDAFIKFWTPLVDSIGIREYRNPLGLDSMNRYVGVGNHTNSFVCPDLWRRLVINVDGTVIPCCRDVGKLMVVGNINSSTIKEIWKSKKMEFLRTTHTQGKAATLKGCKLCEYVGGIHEKK